MKNLVKKIFENGLIISIFSGFAYLLTYHYQKGILSYYKIPLIYIDLNITNIIEMLVYILTFLYIFHFIILLIVDNVPKIQTHKGKQLLFFTIAYFIWAILFLVLFKDNYDTIILITALYLIYVIITVISPAIIIKGKKPYSEKWIEASKKSQNNEIKEQEFKSKMHFYPYSKLISLIGVIVCITMALCNTFTSAGKNHAEKIEEYYIAIDYNNKVVVHYTNDYYILMECTDNVLSNSYQIVPASEIGNITLQNTGQLELEKLTK